MLETLNTALEYFEHNYYDIFVSAVIMVCGIIMAIGVFKPILFNRIKSKHIRKTVLAFSSVALCFVCIAVTFFVKGYDFKNYVAVSCLLSGCTIVTYWLYENTNLRGLIETIGNIVLRKLGNIALSLLSKDEIEEIKAEVKKATAELKATTEAELKKTTTQMKNDKDLLGL